MLLKILVDSSVLCFSLPTMSHLPQPCVDLIPWFCRIGPVAISLVVLRHSLLAQFANKKLRVIGPIHQRGRQKLDRINTFMTGAADMVRSFCLVSRTLSCIGFYSWVLTSMR